MKTSSLLCLCWFSKPTVCEIQVCSCFCLYDVKLMKSKPVLKPMIVIPCACGCKIDRKSKYTLIFYQLGYWYPLYTYQPCLCWSVTHIVFAWSLVAWACCWFFYSCLEFVNLLTCFFRCLFFWIAIWFAKEICENKSKKGWYSIEVQWWDSSFWVRKAPKGSFSCIYGILFCSLSGYGFAILSFAWFLHWFVYITSCIRCTWAMYYQVYPYL